MNNQKALPGLVGGDPGETSRLQKQRVQRCVEDLAACCVLYPTDSLSEEYERLRGGGPPARARVLQHALFAWSVGELVGARPTEPSFSTKRSEATRLLALLRTDSQRLDDPNASCWLRLDNQGRMVLPFTGIIIDCGPQHAGAEVHLAPGAGGVFFTMDGRTELLRFSPSELLSLVPLSDSTCVRVWRLPADGFILDPLTPPYAYGLPEGWRVSPPAPNLLGRWQETLRQVSSLLEPCAPLHWADIRQLVQIIVPLQQFASDRHISSSTCALPGVVYMSWSADMLQIAEALVHEAGHQRLFLYELGGLLVNPPDPPVLRSPWRIDLRPARGLIHGAFAFCGVANLWNTLLSSRDCPPEYRDRLSAARKKVGRQVNEALEVLHSQADLTPLGTQVVEAIESVLQVCVNRPLACGDLERPSRSDATRNETPIWPMLDEPDQKLLDHIFRVQPAVAILSGNTRKEIDGLLNQVSLAPWLDPVTQRTLSIYFLKWCLPLAEASGMDFRSPVLAKAMSAQLAFGLFWRYIDITLDHHYAGDSERLDCEDAAFLILTAAIRQLHDLYFHCSARIMRFLLYFRRYHAQSELGESVRHQDIWRRGTPFFIVPRFLLRGRSRETRLYKLYTNLLGIVHDVVDLWEDLENSRYTWCVRCVLRSPREAVTKMQKAADGYIRALERGLVGRFPIWELLVRDGVQGLHSATTRLAGELSTLRALQ